MPKGIRLGGRSKGTPNKKTIEAAELLASLSCNPLEGMAILAADPKSTPELRGKMYAELAQYIYPKRKAIEVAGSLDVSQGWADIIRERRAKRLADQTSPRQE